LEPVAPPVEVARVEARPLQTVTTTIAQGRVSDASGAVVPGVEVMVANYTTPTAGQVNPDLSHVMTDERGIYTFFSLPPGMYRLVFRLPGFKTLNIDNV